MNQPPTLHYAAPDQKSRRNPAALCTFILGCSSGFVVGAFVELLDALRWPDKWPAFSLLMAMDAATLFFAVAGTRGYPLRNGSRLVIAGLVIACISSAFILTFMFA